MAKEVSAIDTLLVPRQNIPWKHKKGFLSPWARAFIIENRTTRRLLSARLDDEKKDSLFIRDQFETRILSLPAVERRFWLAEFDFMNKLLTVGQMRIYMPTILQLAFLMPRRLVVVRREAVSRFLSANLPEISEFMGRLCRRFVRSSILMYPSYLLFQVAEEFCGLVIRSLDQSAKANRERILMSARALQLMDTHEICQRFNTEEEYSEELSFLRAQCRHYRISVPELCSISAEDVSEFWESSSKDKPRLP